MREILIALVLTVGCGSATDAAPAEPGPGGTGGQSSDLVATGGAETLATGGASTVAATGGTLATGGTRATGGALATGGSVAAHTGGVAATGGTQALSCAEKMCQVTTYQNIAATAGVPCIELFESQCSQYPASCSQVCG